MTRYFIVVIGTLCAVFLWLEQTGSARDLESLKEQVRTLRSQAQEADQECARFFARAQRLEGGLSKRETFRTRELALAELALAEHYPGYPKASSEILSLLSTLSDSEVRDLDIGVLFAAASGCDSVRYYGMLSRLIRSARAFNFSKVNRARISKLIENHVEADLSFQRPALELELDFKLVKLARQMGFELKRKPATEILSGVSKLEQDMSIVASPEKSTAYEKVNETVFLEVKNEIKRASKLQDSLREQFKGD